MYGISNTVSDFPSQCVCVSENWTEKLAIVLNCLLGTSRPRHAPPAIKNWLPAIVCEWAALNRRRNNGTQVEEMFMCAFLWYCRF